MPVALFDLDGTLTRCDTLIPYCLFALLRQPYRIFAIMPVLRGLVNFWKRKVERQELKQLIIIAFLGGLTKGDISRINNVFLSVFLPLIVRRNILRKVRWHQQKGDRVYIVSASPDVYLQSIARAWNFDGLMCTTLEWRDSHLTGRIVGRNCRGDEKARRIRNIFNKRELNGSFAYGDSEEDQAMFQLVSYGIHT